MRNRQRVPTIFSIYMLDVICCALGCVILLWQLKHGEAEEAQKAAQQAEYNWKTANTRVNTVSAEVLALQAALDESKKQSALLLTAIAQTETERDTVKRERDAANRLVLLTKKEYATLRQAHILSEALLKDVRVDLAKLEDKHKIAATALADKVKANAELLLKVAAAEKEASRLTKDVAAQQLDVEEAAKRLREQLAKLRVADAKNRDLEKTAADLRAAGKEALAKLTINELRAKVLEQELERNKKDVSASDQQLLAAAKDLGVAKATIAALQQEKSVLVDRTRAIQAEADQRFAGIALTGKNILFLVDMSGSMAMIDENTFDPDKWPLVCETVAQLMRSIKGLQHYQILLFSDKVRYPMGSPATWLRYDPKATPQKVLAALKATRPEGETNMHAVFTEAFRYREAGLDTIYVLSDGLPNAGNVTPPGNANLSDAQRTEFLSKHLRNKLKTDWNRPIAGQPRVRINSIGFFFESPDVGAFLWALSREHDGSFVGMSK